MSSENPTKSEILTEIMDSLKETRPDLHASIDQNGNLEIRSSFEVSIITVSG